MDDLERRLTALFGEPAPADAPPGLAARIHRAVSVRRRNRLVLALSVAAAAAVLVVLPLAVRGENGGAATTASMSTASPEVTITVTASPLRMPAGVRLEHVLPELMNVKSIVDVQTHTAQGERFTPAALSSDGTILGTTPDGLVAQAGTDGGTPKSLDFTARSGLGGAAGWHTWTEVNGSTAEQRCRSADGSTRTISPQGTDPQARIWVDGDVIVGSDVMRQPWVAKGCTQKGTVLKGAGPDTGVAVAFSHPYLFTADRSNDKVLRVIDVETGKVAAEHPLPEGVRAQRMGRPDQKWYATASGEWFAWVTGDTLRWMRLGSWGPVSTLRGVPTPEKDASAWMTAGNRLITYNTANASFLLDPLTQRLYETPDVILAAGDWLLWSNGEHYRLAHLG